MATTHARTVGLLAITATLGGLAGCGSGGGKSGGDNAKRFPAGPKREIAALVDQLQTDARAGDADAICHKLFTDRLAGLISVQARAPCIYQVRRQLVRKGAKFSLLSIRAGKGAGVGRVRDFTGKTSKVFFVKQGDAWFIDGIFSYGS